MARKFKHTVEQKAIIDAVVNTDDNIMVTALAGSGKTSTLESLSKVMKESSALCLAFNKSIANEMSERLDSRCTAVTLNALGHRAWAATIGKRIKLNRSKMYFMLKHRVEGAYDQDQFKGSAFNDMLKVTQQGKVHGFLPKGIPNTKPLYTEDDFFETTDVILSPAQQQVVIDISRESYEEARFGIIDFDDQILCSTVSTDVTFPRYPLYLIDEAQDLSDLNHEMLAKMVGNTGRLIAVGDSFQAIYAFRGAEERSMGMMMKRFNMIEMKLTVSFRCAQAIVENQSRAPEMTWFNGAPMGEVLSYKAWTPTEIPDGSAIICRNNAPLFTCALNFLKNGIKPTLGNKDIISQVVKNLKNLGPKSMKRDAVLTTINDWVEKTGEKRRDKDSVNDMAECLRVFADRSKTLGDAMKLAKEIEEQEGGIYLSTIHRAKGLEWGTVSILDVELIKIGSEKDNGQEANIRYVSETRAKHTLNYITSEGFVDSYEKRG